jgi:hypothetical protein
MEMTRPGRAGSTKQQIRPERSGMGRKIFLPTRSNSDRVAVMHALQRLSLPERVAAHLREGIRQGQWSDPFPGVPGPGARGQEEDEISE